jgi:hypothetical protein
MSISKILQDGKVAACVVLAAALVGRAVAQETRGFKFNNLTVSPYVNFEYMYDSNVNYDQDDVDDSILRVSPGVDLSYRGNEWGLSGNAWCAYDWYASEDDLNAFRYGERLDFYRESAKGWKLVLGESYLETSQDDSLVDGGRGLWRDRNEFELTGALSYEFSERMSATLSAQYSDLTYANDNQQYASLYGWREWSVGLELARKISEKSDFLVAGSYQEYTSEGAVGIGSGSTGFSLQAGFGSRATERIRYRVLTGASWFDYADGDQLVGWTYSADASYVINKKWAATVAGSSFYQPSEQEINQAMQVYTASAGLTYKPWRRLTAKLDVAWRREENQYAGFTGAASTDDLISARLRADYQLQQFTTLYSAFDYEDRSSDGSSIEYDRLRFVIGVNLRY